MHVASADMEQDDQEEGSSSEEDSDVEVGDLNLFLRCCQQNRKLIGAINFTSINRRFCQITKLYAFPLSATQKSPTL